MRKESQLFIASVNWKTTIAGIGALATAIGLVITDIQNGGTFALSEHLDAISVALAGIGLIAARDGDKSSEEAGAL